MRWLTIFLLSFLLEVYHIRAIRIDATRSKRVVVIGGGAAGYFSAIECARLLREARVPAEVFVMEAGKAPLSKVLVSGGGRCNVMHNPNKDLSLIVKAYPRGQRELISPYTKVFGPWDTLDWFENHGLELKAEQDGRMFPTSDRSQSVVDVLEKAASSSGVQVVCGTKVLSVDTSVASTPTTEGGSNISNEARFAIVTQGEGKLPVKLSVGENGDYLLCDRVIVATGSSRIGYKIAEKLGHKIPEVAPSLFSMKVTDTSLCQLSGVSNFYTKVKLQVPKSLNLRIFATALPLPALTTSLTQRGPLLVTKEGVSGPAVLKLSAYAAKILAALQYKATIEVSWAGEMKAEDVKQHLALERSRHPNRLIGKGFPYMKRNMLPLLVGDDEEGLALGYYPEHRDVEEEGASENMAEDDIQVITRRLWMYLLQRANIDSEKKWSQVDVQDIDRIVKEVTSCELSTNGRGLYRDEFVTCGGIPLKDVFMDRMESKLCAGVFFCGEILDVDGITGGFNFQAAWSTGYIAGKSCAESLLSSTVPS